VHDRERLEFGDEGVHVEIVVDLDRDRRTTRRAPERLDAADIGALVCEHRRDPPQDAGRVIGLEQQGLKGASHTSKATRNWS
jgi:hypothetical protein